MKYNKIKCNVPVKLRTDKQVIESGTVEIHEMTKHEKILGIVGLVSFFVMMAIVNTLDLCAKGC